MQKPYHQTHGPAPAQPLASGSASAGNSGPTPPPRPASPVTRPFPPGWLFALVLVAATLTAYLPALQGGFVWDDGYWTTRIPNLLRDVSGLQTMWFDPTALQQYYPLTGTSFWLDYHCWGFRTLPYHVENVLLHAFAAVLFWRWLQRLQVPGARLAGAIFALHPLMVESAGWITERKNVLSLVLYLGALLAYGRFTRFWKADQGTVPPGGSSAPRPWGMYGLALLLFVAADLSKATAFSLPAVLLLVGWWKLGRVRWRADVAPSLPFFALAIGFGLVTAWLERHHVGAQGPEWALSLPQRCLIAGQALWFYAGKVLWPAKLCFVYPRWQPDPASLRQWLYPLTAAGIPLALWVARQRIGRGPVTALCFFAGTLFPVLGFMNAYGMRYAFVWDHWAYLSSLGLIALIAALVVQTAERLHTPRSLYGLGGVALAVLGGLTWHQAKMYADLETLWGTTLEQNPGAAIAHTNLGNLLLQRGQVDAAIAHYQKALQVQPALPETHYNLGLALFQQGRVDQAIAQYREALQLKPDSPDTHCHLGIALYQKSRPDEAVQQFEEAIRLDPALASPYNCLGRAYASQGKLDEATAMFSKAILLNPTLAEAHYYLANGRALQGNLTEAVAEMKTALRLEPNQIEAQMKLADTLLKLGKGAEAIPYCEAVVKAKPEDAHAHFVLGSAWLATKRLEPAAASFREAARLAPDSPDCMNALAWIYATSPQAELRNGAEAVRLAEGACKITQRQQTALLDTLAAAYAEAGRFDKAIQTTEELRALAVAAHDTNTVDTTRQRLELYQAGKPYRDAP